MNLVRSTPPPMPLIFAESYEERLADVKVKVGYLCYDRTVPVDFVTSLHCLQMPPHAEILPQSGRTQADCREALALRAVEQGFTHVLMLDNDMVYPSDTLIRLLLDEVDVVCGFALTRLPPHLPVFGPAVEKRFFYAPMWPTHNGRRDGEPLSPSLQLTGVASGAGLLISTEALKRMPRPWFAYTEYTENLDLIGEDTYFSQKCRDHDVEMHCHTDLVIGHMTQATIVPTRIQRLDGSKSWEMHAAGLGDLFDGPSEKKQEDADDTPTA